MPTRANPTQVIETCGVVDVAALDVIRSKAGGGGEIWLQLNTTGSNPEVATVDVATIREADIRVDRIDVQVSPRVPGLEIQQPCVLLCEVASIIKCTDGTLIQCLQEGWSCSTNIPGDSVRGTVRSVG
jgi:hypothetical protein